MTLRTYMLMCAVLMYVGITAFRVSVSAGLDHDENQFITSAFLVAEQGLHPYQDFPNPHEYLTLHPKGEIRWAADPCTDQWHWHYQGLETVSGS